MAQSEPMDVVCMDSDFDNKENTFHHNVPCTEKGYEELDVSELNMKLRYSMSPASSPMSKSYTACPDNRYLENSDALNSNTANLTRSLNSAMTKNDNVISSLKSLPLQSLGTEQFADGNRNANILRQQGSEDANITVTISGANDIDENLSLPSSSSSVLHTPEATTPTKEIKEAGSPIIRGLKSVLNMFRSSTSPVPPAESENFTVKQEVFNPENLPSSESSMPHAVASTPIAAHRTKDVNSSKQSSPYKDSIIFNDDLEKELNWKDEKTACSPEKMSIPKLILQNSKTSENKTANVDLNVSNTENNYYSVIEYMDISNNQSIVQDKTITDCHTDNHDVSIAVESDGEFVDCETTFSKSESYVLDVKEIQEKMTSKADFEETKHVLDTTKYTEFVDCDSSSLLSKNESYVLDIKEIHEKISAKVNLDQAKHTSLTTENTPIMNQTIDGNATSMSFVDFDLKFDTTMPTDYSDYSQATTEILSALEKLEECENEKNNQINSHIQYNITKQKDVAGQQENISESITKYISSEKSDLTQINESQENQLNLTENMGDELDTTLTEIQNIDIEQSNKPKTINTSEKPLDTIQCTDFTVESENKCLQSQEVTSAQVDISNVECEDKAESSYDTNNADQTLETTILQNCSVSEGKNVLNTEILSKECTETSIKTPDHIAETPVSVMSNSIQNDVMPVEIVNSGVNKVLSETLSNSNRESIAIPPSDLPLPDDEIVETLLNTLDVAENVTAVQTVDSQITENPSDVPLPADDVDEKLSEIVITSGEMVSVSTSETIITLSEPKVSDTIPVAVDALIESKSNNDLIVTDGPSETQLSEFPPTVSINIEFSDIKTLCENQITNNEIVLPELDSSSLITDSHLHLKEAALTTPDLNSSEIIKKIADNVCENKTNDNLPSETVESSNITVTQDNSGINVNEMTNNFSNNINENINVIDNSAYSQNPSEIEPMDITLNESLNLTHELPDLVSQTIVLAEDKVPKSNDTFDVLSNSSDAINDNNLIFENVLNMSQSTSDFQSESVLIHNTIPMNENIIKVSEQKVVSILSMNGDKWPARETETIKVSNVNISSTLSDDQPPKIFTNMPEPEPMEIEGTTVDEEIIVSADNSPYVSLMSDVKPLLEQNQDDEKIENLASFEEKKSKESEQNGDPKIISEPDKIDEPEKNEVIEKIEELEKNEKLKTIKKLCKPEETEKNEKLENNEKSDVIEGSDNFEKIEKAEEPKTVVEREKTEDAFEEIENPLVANSNVSSSPPITSKGYNFNFDEIDDPFATKTKIRLSPPLDTPNKSVEADKEKDKQYKEPTKGAPNRRKSQPPERKKPILNKRFNTSFEARSKCEVTVNKLDSNVIIDQDKMNINDTIENEQILETKVVKPIDNTQKENINANKDKNELKKKKDQGDLKIDKKIHNTLQISDENKMSIGSGDAILNDFKTASSSEQSAYYSAGASSTESFHSKNVFNLPEIEDANFNPFATKSKIRQSPTRDTDLENPFATRSKMCQSPPLVKDIDNPFATRSKIRSSPEVSIINDTEDINYTATLNESNLTQLVKHVVGEDKMETELMEKNTSVNNPNSTSSSRATDNDLTTQEVNTEDEDTVEGPFLDADEEIDKLNDFAGDNDDMMMFNEIQEAARPNDDNLDGELFIDAEAFEFLLNQNKSNVVADSGKESLFLKFDPLFAKRISSDGVLASLNKGQKRQSTPTKPNRPSLHNEASPVSVSSTTPSKHNRTSICKEMSPLAGPSTLNATYEGENNISQESNDDANITVTKPMMVVTPALNPAVTPRNKSITPARSNRRSITFTSPAIAVIDRLLSMSANNSIVGHDSTITSTQSNGEQTEADLALTQLRELLAEKEISVYNLRSESKELKDRLSTMESQVKILEADGEARLKKINELNERLIEKTKINKSMASVVEEYERTIASLIADIEQDKKRNAEERIRLINERDEQTAHLTSMEVSFSDLHSKYEKSKQVILTCKANEDVYKKTIQDFEEQVTKMQTNYEMLKQHATAKLNHANQELEKINRAHEAEVVKLNAMIKRNQLLATSLQETLTQKTKANDELTAICDELINKVGSNK